MKDEYDLDYLEKVFDIHSKEYEERCNKHPNTIIDKDFNLPKALLTLVIEMKRLKEDK